MNLHNFEKGTPINKIQERNFLSQEQLQKAVPAAFATMPVKDVSRHYTFVPTSNIVQDLNKLGWLPVKAVQQKTKGDADSMKHTIRFANSNKNLKK